MQVMRTPDARFTGIPDWEFAPRHLDLPTTLKGGHMVQEDSPEAIVELIDAHAARGAAHRAKA